VLAPQPGATVAADSLTVVVLANEPPVVSYVRASVGSRSTFLTYAGDRQWSGKVDLVGLAGRDQTLRVVTVAPADSLVQLVPFVSGQVPDLALALPLEGTVARPELRIAGSCADASPCTLTVRVDWAALFTRTGVVGFDTTVSLAPFQGPGAGEPQALTVTAGDPQGNSSTARRTVFIEPSTRLVEVGSAGVQVLDVDSTRLLFRDSTAAGVDIAVLDVASGVRTSIHPLRPGGIVTGAYLTPAGAIVALLSTSLVDSIFELRGGTASFVTVAARYRLRAAGEWAVWHSGTSTLYRRNTTTGFQELVHANGTEGDVAPNGDVAFTSGGYVWWYHGGATLQLGRGSVPRTDGTQVVYGFKFSTESSVRIYRHDGVNETLLANSFLDLSNPRYAVNGGWAVYVGVATNATQQLFSRAPDGTVRQVTTGGGVQVEAISSTGDVTFPYGPRLFSSPPYASTTAVSRVWFSNPVRFRGATAFTTIGRTGYRIVP
jgi:hypothetical protein